MPAEEQIPASSDQGVNPEKRERADQLVSGATVGASGTLLGDGSARDNGAVHATEQVSLAADVGFLAGHGFSFKQLALASQMAAMKAIPASEWMIHRGLIGRNAYLERLAQHLGVQFQHRPLAAEDRVAVIVDPATSDAPCGTIPALSAAAVQTDGRTRLVAAPSAINQRLPAHLASIRDHRNVLLMPSAALRSTLHAIQSRHWMRQARSGLADALPHYSASRRLSTGQAVALLVAIIVIAAGAAYAPMAAISLIGGLLTGYYFATVILRLNLLGAFPGIRRGARLPVIRPAPEDLPVYSVLVALHDEANQVAELTAALQRLDWPHSKLEIFLVCEADDEATIAAVNALALPEQFRLVCCPPGLPRTKPKALNFALPLCTGKFVVIFDAEDRPHPLQLMEAWHAFEEDGDGKLACLQAPLSIHNADQNWLTAMFAIEYDTLFRGMLPVLAAKAVPLPLGGTSNHFRADLLRWAGGWDPYNVTEDADLGIRLARLGYRCDTLWLATQEEAPAKLSGWIGQRTRWLKGWMQTILVHSRHPLRTARDLGPRGVTYFHLVLTAIVISMLVHPVFLLHFGWWIAELAQGRAMGPIETAFFIACLVNLAGGYLAYGLLADAVIRRSGSRHNRWALLTLPFYWLLISIAGWRAVLQLVFSPFHWEKTAHGLAKSRFDHNIGDKELP